jgi:hypothetical protein
MLRRVEHALDRPVSRMAPSFITMTWCAMARITSTSCVISK